MSRRSLIHVKFLPSVVKTRTFRVLTSVAEIDVGTVVNGLQVGATSLFILRRGCLWRWGFEEFAVSGISSSNVHSLRLAVTSAETAEWICRLD